MAMITILKPIYDNRASFYGKASLHQDNQANKLTLISYTTIVTEISLVTGKARVFGTYSATTLRHIKEFLKQNDLKADNAKQIMADYGVQE